MSLFKDRFLLWVVGELYVWAGDQRILESKIRDLPDDKSSNYDAKSCNLAMFDDGESVEHLFRMPITYPTELSGPEGGHHLISH